MADAMCQDQSGNPPSESFAPALPDYLTSPDAVSADEGVQWRFGKAPDYSNTRRVWAEGKTVNHAAGSLPELVENLVKNWEVEASFKTRLQDWRTVDHDNYTFAMNGESPQTAEYMLECGTYNAIIQPNEFYSPLHSNFASSHKTFKRMMPTFAWEVIEVYSGPPKVAFKWRHWGVMKNDYVGFNDKGEKVTAKAHGGPIEIFGITTAQVDDKVRLQTVDTYMDPLAMFRKIAPNGIVNKEPMNQKVKLVDALDAQSEQNGIPVELPQAEQRESFPQETMVQDVPHGIAPDTDTPMLQASSLAACPFASHQYMNANAHTEDEQEPLHQVASTNGQISEHQVASTNGQISEHQVASTNGQISEQKELMIETGTEKANHSIFEVQEAPLDVSPHSYAQMSEERPVKMDLDTATPESEEKTIAGAEDTLAFSNGFKTDVDDTCVPKETPLAYAAPEETSDCRDKMPSIMSDVSDPVQNNVVENGTGQNDTEHMEDVQENNTHPQRDVHPHPNNIELDVQPKGGDAVAAPSASDETRQTHQEMSKISSEEASVLMNQE